MKLEKGGVWGVAGKACLWLLVLGLCTGLIYPIFATATSGHPRSCLSQIKQLNLAAIMYQSDADDKSPPFFTFEGPEPTKKFIASMMPYCKNEQLFLCPKDNNQNSEHAEGLAGKMSYVHCLSLKGLIPGYSVGKRVLNAVSDIQDASKAPYLRDPIRGFGTSDAKGGETSQPAILSPHGAQFNFSYLDGHVKARKPVTEILDL